MGSKPKNQLVDELDQLKASVSRISIVLLIVLTLPLFISACGRDSAPLPTMTAYPTYTLYPTFTPMESLTETPVVIDIPDVKEPDEPPLGIEVPPGYRIEHLVKPPLISPSAVEIGPDDGIYVTEWNGNRLLKIDRDGTVSTYLEFDQPLGGIQFSSVGDVITFQGEDMVRVTPDGDRSVIATLQSPASWAVGPDDHLYVVIGEELLQFTLEGQKSILVTGLEASGEMAISPSGEIFIADWPRGRILKIDLAGNVSVLADGFAYDAFNIAFDNQGNLYQNQSYLTQVSLMDGSLSPPILSEFNVVLNCRPFTFDSSGNVIFIGPTTNNVFIASIPDNQVSVLVGGPGNSYGLAVSLSGDLFLGASNEFPVEEGQVVEVGPDGRIYEFASGFFTIKDIVFDGDGNMYVSDVDYGGDGGGRIIRIAPDRTATIIFSGFYDLNNLVLEAALGSFLAFDNNSRQLLRITPPNEVSPVHYDFGGEIHTVELTPDANDHLIALVIFLEDFDVGPVHRSLFRISPDQQVTHLADIDTPLAGTEDAVVVSPSGDIFVVGPEEHPVFRMLKITPQGAVSVFARNLPFDTWSLTMNDAGDIFFTCSAGLFRIYETE